MAKSFIDEWIELIRPLFPKDALIEPIQIDSEHKDGVLRIDWKLGNDPDRKYKRSRTINVIISREAIDDCRDFKKAGSKFKKVIEKRFSNFNPDHDTPMHSSSPVEEWIISTFDIN